MKRFLSATFIVAALAGSALADSPSHAIAVMGPLGTSTVSGTIRFESSEGGLHVTGDLKGLRPQGRHGFHIHEFGDCSAPDGTSAGGHFMLPGTRHGSPEGSMRHLGDLGNITSDDTGSAKYDRMDPNLSLSGANGVIGRSVVIHAGEDDQKTDPAGNSGPRIGCGVIGVAK